MKVMINDYVCVRISSPPHFMKFHIHAPEYIYFDQSIHFLCVYIGISFLSMLLRMIFQQEMSYFFYHESIIYLISLVYTYVMAN